MESGRSLVGAAGSVTNGTLEGIRELLERSLSVTAQSLEGMSGAPLVDRTRIGAKLKAWEQGVKSAKGSSTEALSQAIRSARNAFEVTLRSLDVADEAVHRALLENIPVASIVGESFAGLVTISKIRPAFRLEGRDVTAAEMAEAAASSGLPRFALCLPGMFTDEGVWSAGSSAQPLTTLLREAGFFPVCVRFNPGVHLSDNGHALLGLMEDFLSQPAVGSRPVDVLTYSQGGLILRSALLLAKEKHSGLTKRVRRAVLISSPDGGSGWEKIGFWLGLALESMPYRPVQWAGFIGNQRSDAMKDLSHGIIREEDWKKPGHLQRYRDQRYFGELDDVDAYQVYSLISDRDDRWTAWFGDGIVEKPSLTLLSAKVYRAKPAPEKRVTCILGTSHFSIMQAEKLREILQELLVFP